jgi:polyhydroxybutyrate depolymerase
MKISSTWLKWGYGVAVILVVCLASFLVVLQPSEVVEKEVSTVDVETKTEVISNLGERLERQVTVDGVERTYTLFMPREQVAPGENYPILFAFHPALASGLFMEETAPFHIASGTETFAVVYPDGYEKTFNVGGCCGAAYEAGVDDVAFFKAMMEDVATMLPIRSQAYVTGFSNGALLTYRLMCDVPELIAAAVPYAGAIRMDDCASLRSVPVMHVNGGADAMTLTGTVDKTSSRYKNTAAVLTTPYTALDAVAKRNGCDVTRTPSTGLPAMDATCEAYTGCSGAPVMMCIIPGLGHAWPGSGDAVAASRGIRAKIAERTGPYRSELDSTGPIVDFFLQY